MIFVIKYGIIDTRIPKRERMSPEPMDINIYILYRAFSIV